MAKTTTKPLGRARPSKPQLTDAQVAEHAKALDDGREALKQVTEKAAAAQEKLTALPADASQEQRAEAERELAEVKLAVDQARNKLEALMTVVGQLPPANKKSTHNPSESDQGGAGDVAGSAAGLVTVTVIGPARGLRRAGFHFNAVPQTVEVTPKQKAAIEADPQLSLADGASVTVAERKDALARLTLEDFDFGGRKAVEVKVLGPKAGRRRAGFAFGEEAQLVKVDKDQLVLILGDPDLAVAAA